MSIPIAPLPLPTPNGMQWLADLHDCQATTLRNDALTLQTACLKHVQDSGLSIVGQQFYQFNPIGVTGVVLLAESHLAIHTWPEQAFVSIDLYVCHFSQDNQAKGEQLLATLINYFASQRPHIQCIVRGAPLESI
jgi:S-adenosylmethionine decarboxylase